MTTLVQLDAPVSVSVNTGKPLVYGKANAKLKGLEKATGRKVSTFSLLSGWTCPFATECLSKVRVGDDGRKTVHDGPDTQFRCFSASQEALYPSVYDSRKHNGDMMQACSGPVEMADLIERDLPKVSKRSTYQKLTIRIHVGGDFFSQAYFDAWAIVAKRRPDVLFYAYTKSLRYWIDCSYVPENFILTASRGGRHDHLISEHNLREARVVFSVQEAKDLGLEIDSDDSHAARPELREQSFALLIHGVQPKGSDAAKALNKLNGVGTYGKGNNAK